MSTKEEESEVEEYVKVIGNEILFYADVDRENALDFVEKTVKTMGTYDKFVRNTPSIMESAIITEKLVETMETYAIIVKSMTLTIQSP